MSLRNSFTAEAVLPRCEGNRCSGKALLRDHSCAREYGPSKSNTESQKGEPPWLPKNNTKYKFGYAYIPQVKTIYVIMDSKDLFGIFDTGQNVKHLVTIGSQLQFSTIILDYGLKYSLLKWRRDYVNGDWIIEDEYMEQEIGLFLNLVFRPINKKGRV